MRIIGSVSLVAACLACGSSNTKSAASPAEVDPQYSLVDLPHPEAESMLPSGCKDEDEEDCLPPLIHDLTGQSRCHPRGPQGRGYRKKGSMLKLAASSSPAGIS